MVTEKWFAVRGGWRIVSTAAVIAAAALTTERVEAQDAVCGEPTQFCSSALESACLRTLGAGAAGVAVDAACRIQLDSYRECLTLVASQCPSDAPVRRAAGAPAASALEIWNEIKEVQDADVMEAFADSYPASPLAVLARKRAGTLRRAADGDATVEPRAEGPTDEERAAAAEAERLRAQFREAQGHLNRIGYPVGAADGVWGGRSSAALRRFLADQGRPMGSILTPETMALLRVTPDDAAPRPEPVAVPAQAVEPVRGTNRPVAPEAQPGLVAKLKFRFRYNNRFSTRCATEVPVEARAFSVTALPLPCGDGALTLRTDAAGRARGSAVSFEGEHVALNGNRWRYSGRRVGRGTNPNDLRDVTLDVSFQER